MCAFYPQKSRPSRSPEAGWLQSTLLPPGDASGEPSVSRQGFTATASPRADCSTARAVTSA